MSLVQFFPKEIPQFTRGVVERMLPADSIFRLLGEEAQEIFDEAAMVEMYHHRGRGALNPVMMSIVLILQYFHNLPDREAADAARMRLDWKYALRQELDWEGFNYASIHYFRKRLLAHGQEYEVFQQVLRYLEETGYAKSWRIRTDATHIIGNIARLSRLELVCETLRLALVALISADSKWALARLSDAFVNVYGEKRSEYKLSKAQIAKMMQGAGRDGYLLLEQIEKHGKAEWLELEEIKTLAEVLDQQYERSAEGDEDDGKSRLAAPRSKPKQAAICSPHDPQARFGVKGQTKWLGWKVHLSETIDSPFPIIADIGVHSALQTDEAALPEIQDRLAGRGMLPEKQYADRGYTSGKTIEESAARGVNLRGNVREDTRKPPGFRLGDFYIDKANRRAQCPAGKWSASFNHSKQSHVDYLVRFGKQCLKCPFMSQCTSDKRGRSLEISVWQDSVSERRLEQALPWFDTEMQVRNRVESAFSETKRRHGMRRSRYRGRRKLGLQVAFTATAVNLKRYAGHLADDAAIALAARAAYRGI